MSLQESKIEDRQAAAAAATTGGTQPKVKTLFSKKKRATDVEVKLTYPKLYPGVEFGFVLRMQLSSEGDKMRSEYLGMKQEERRAASEQHSLDMLCDLILQEPVGFEDFPAARYTGDDAAKQLTDLQARTREYFGETDADGKLLEAWLVTQVIAAYWSSVLPGEYL